MSTVPQLAKQMYDALERRESGDKRQEYFLKEGSPEWMRDVVFAASDNTSFYTVYDFVNEAVGVIAGCEDDEDEIRDRINEIEADVYTAELTAWLAENVNHVYFITEVLENYGAFDDGFQLLMAAQAEHKHQVANAVFEAIKAQADGDDDEGEGDDPEADDYTEGRDTESYTSIARMGAGLPNMGNALVGTPIPIPDNGWDRGLSDDLAIIVVDSPTFSISYWLRPSDFDYDGLNDTNTYPREYFTLTHDMQQIAAWLSLSLTVIESQEQAEGIAYMIVTAENYQRWLWQDFKIDGVEYTVPAPGVLFNGQF